MSYSKINKKFKKQWVKALRSAKFEQGRECLRDTDNNFCCLGVACHLLRPNLWAKRENSSAFIMRMLPSSVEGNADSFSEAYMPVQLAKKVGLCDEAQGHLASMNDDDDCSFEEIANWIEENL